MCGAAGTLWLRSNDIARGVPLCAQSVCVRVRVLAPRCVVKEAVALAVEIEMEHVRESRLVFMRAEFSFVR